MANVDHPHGFRPLMRNLSGGDYTVRQYTKDSSESAAIFTQDIVHQQADGNIAAAGATPGTTRFLGVALNYGAASQETEHLVIVSPDAVYEAQDNNDTDGYAAADRGLNANVELNAGSTTTLLSGHELDESTYAATNSLDVKTLGLLNVPDNEYGAYARIEVVINKHQMREGAGI